MRARRRRRGSKRVFMHQDIVPAGQPVMASMLHHDPFYYVQPPAAAWGPRSELDRVACGLAKIS